MGASFAQDGALGLASIEDRLLGVVASAAPAYAQSYQARRPISAPVGATIADGISCRSPDPEALSSILRGVSRVVCVSEEEICAAMRILFATTHNVAEGAGAVSLAGLMQERDRMRRRKVAIVLSGGNIDTARFAGVLAGGRQ